MSLRALADELGLSVSTVRDIETGASTGADRYVEALINLSDCNTHE